MEAIKTYTRGIDKEYYKILFKELKVWEDGEMVGDGNVYDNMQEANEFLIRTLYGKTQEEVDGLEVHEYDKLLKEIDTLKKGKATPA